MKMSREVSDTFDGKRLQENLSESLTDIEKIKWAEEAAIKLYTQHTYKFINPALRRGDMPIGHRNFVYTLCSALTKLPKFIGSVRRIAELPYDIQESYHEGEIVNRWAFMSTSTNKGGVRVFRNNTNKNYNTTYFIQSKTGRDISKLSAWPDENEVLFPAGARFMVTETFRPYFSSMKYIWLRELD